MAASPLTRIARLSARFEAYLSTNAFILLFLAFYLCANLQMFFWGAVTEFKHQNDIINENAGNPDFFFLISMRWYIAVARGFGYILNLNTAFVILLAARLFFTWLRDTPLAMILPLDKAFPSIHILVGYVIAISVVFHGAFHMVWLVNYDQFEAGLWGFTQSAVTGWVLFLVFAIMLIFTHPRIRAKNFRAFYMVHLVGAFLFFGLLIFHGMYNKVPETYKYITPPLIIYILDRIIRRYKVSTSDLQLTHEHSIFKDNNILQLKVPKPFEYQSGQYAEIQVSSINHEWHPFTIASSPHESHMSFYIKNLGDWTGKLHQNFQARLDGDETHPLSVRVRGPYGAPCQHVSGYDRVVLVSGGIGATPFSSVCKHLHHLQTLYPKPSTPPIQEAHRSAQHRVDQAISGLYDINMAAGDDSSVASSEEFRRESRRIYVSNMLRLTSFRRSSTAGHDNQMDDLDFDAIPVEDEETSASSAQDSSEYLSNLKKPGAVVVEGEKKEKKNGHKHRMPWLQHRRKARQHTAKLAHVRARLLAFLHTTRVSMFLLLTLIVRIFLISLGSILGYTYHRISNTVVEQQSGHWVAITDTALGFIFVLILPPTILLELSFMGTRYFNRLGRCVDFFAFLPLTIVCSALQIRTWITGEPESLALVLLHYAIFIPVMFLLLCYRMYRSIGSGKLLNEPECTCNRHKHVPDVDFVWTTPKDADDAWLRSELTPLSESPDASLRLHRYVTREKIDPESGDYGINSHAGRPDWDALFTSISRHVPSNSVVGVFFCGPHPMGSAVQKSLRYVEQATHLRAAYLAGDDNAVMLDAGVDVDELARLKERGGNVRFVYREENFG